MQNTEIMPTFALRLYASTRRHRSKRLYWLDHFVLRQCQPDFTPKVVIEVIKEIGLVFADIKRGTGIGNLARSFCVLELYAAVAWGLRIGRGSDHGRHQQEADGKPAAPPFKCNCKSHIWTINIFFKPIFNFFS